MSSFVFDSDYYNLLKDFLLLEMIHDYKTKELSKSKSDVISTNRYKKKHQNQNIINKNNFDYILELGVPPSTTTTTFYNFNTTISRAITNNEPETTFLRFMTNLPKKTTFQKFMINKILASESGIVGKHSFTCPVSNFTYDVVAVTRTSHGTEFANLLFDKNPVILTDTIDWVFKEFKSHDDDKKPNYGSVTKIFCFSPLVVRADSASKANTTDLETIKNHNPVWFESEPSKGVELVNIISNKSYETGTNSSNPGFNQSPTTGFNQSPRTGFFSKFGVSTFKNPYDTTEDKISQKWNNLSFAGTSGELKLNDAHYENNRVKTFEDISTRINSPPLNDSQSDAQILLANDKKLQNLVDQAKSVPPSVTSTNAKLNAEIVSLALQRKRSGDWLPVSYLLDYNDDPSSLELIDNSLKIDSTGNQYLHGQKIDNSHPYAEFFKKDNMFILTNDRPLVAYCILRGVNVLFTCKTSPACVIKFQKRNTNPEQPVPYEKVSLDFSPSAAGDFTDNLINVAINSDIKVI